MKIELDLEKSVSKKTLSRIANSTIESLASKALYDLEYDKAGFAKILFGFISQRIRSDKLDLLAKAIEERIKDPEKALLLSTPFKDAISAAIENNKELIQEKIRNEISKVDFKTLVSACVAKIVQDMLQGTGGEMNLIKLASNLGGKK